MQDTIGEKLGLFGHAWPWLDSLMLLKLAWQKFALLQCFLFVILCVFQSYTSYFSQCWGVGVGVGVGGGDGDGGSYWLHIVPVSVWFCICIGRSPLLVSHIMSPMVPQSMLFDIHSGFCETTPTTSYHPLLLSPTNGYHQTTLEWDILCIHLINSHLRCFYIDRLVLFQCINCLSRYMDSYYKDCHVISS